MPRLNTELRHRSERIEILEFLCSNLMVYRLHQLFFIAVFTFVGMNPFDSALASQDSVKIQITHSHEHAHEDHHHGPLPDVSSDKTAEHSQSNQTDKDSHHSDQHSHDFVVSCAHTLFIEIKPILDVAVGFVALFPAPKEQTPPRNRALGSIFRPPITTIIS